MLGRTQTSRGFAAACAALVLAAAACSRDSATTGPTGLQSKDFAANLRLVSGDQQLGPITASLTQPIVVRVVDAGGQAVAGATVTFAVRLGGGAITPAANISGSDGLVTAVWTMGNTVGAAKAVATLTNVFVLDSAVFTATATTGPASLFTKVSGDNQTTNATHTLGAPLVVKVQDAAGNRLSGVKVTWTPAATNGSVSFVVDTTASDGTAAANWTLGTLAGAQTLTATIPGGVTPLTFKATATADTGRRIIVLSSPAATGGVGSSAGYIKIRVEDQLGNVIAGAPVAWNDSIAGGGSVSPTASSTPSTGVDSTRWTLGPTPGSQLVRIRVGSTTAVASFFSTATVAFSDVYAGNFMACGISATSNNVYCWGAGTDGQLGQGSATNSNAPSLAVASGGVPIQVRQLTGGRNGFCALSIGRTLSCWGKTAMAAQSNSPTSVSLTINSGTAFPNFVGLGEDFSCIATLAGDVGCSGVNLHGQLGNGAAPAGSAVGTFSPILPLGAVWSNAVVGRTHGCAMPRYAGTVASQRPMCWGLNNEGQAGTGNGAGTFTDVLLPKVITMPTATMRFDSTLTAGATHTCATEAALSDNQGKAWCWGSNGYGQLGSSAVAVGAGRNDTPKAVDFPAGVTAWSRIYAGEFHTCAIEAAGSSTPGKAWCWGRNDYGQLGTGSVGAPSGTAVAVNTGLVFRSLSLGELFTCGVVGPAINSGSPSQPAGTVYCWGDNLFGQLGNSAPGNTPVLTVTKVANQP